MTVVPYPIDASIQAPTFSGQYGGETVADACIRGWGYRIRCVACGHEAEWSSDALLTRFAAAMGATMREVAERLVCPVQNCRSRRLLITAFQSVPIDTGHRHDASMEERRRMIMAKAEEIARGRDEG